MSVHFLIDFENVREDGLSAVKSAQAGDTVYLIYTANAAKINLDAVAGFRAGLKIIKVAAGKQSLDMHLVSIMGFLINAFGQDDSYVVVSNDNGFDGVVKFWKAEGYDTKCLKTAEVAREEKHTQGTMGRGNNRSRRVSQSNRPRSDNSIGIDEKTSHVKEDPQGEARQEPVQEALLAETIVPSEVDAFISPEENDSLPELSEMEELQMEEAAKSNSIAVSSDDEKESVPSTEVQTVSERSINRGRHGRSNGNNKKSSEAVKAASASVKLSDADEKPDTGNAVPVKRDQPLQAEARTALNNKLQGLLAEGGADGTVAGQVASVVLKNIGSKNYKQVIYRTITHKFGQKKGLEYYNLIKNYI